MKKILLVCNAGMSTSMLVRKMQDNANSRSIDVSIEAKSLTEAKGELKNVDVILIGPQIRYELENVRSLAGDVPVDAINMRDYGMMDGEKVLDFALDLMKK